MNIFSLENVSKQYGIKPLLEGVTFGLDAQDKVGIIGANGSGKTTLLRIIAGQEPPDTGRIVRATNQTVAFLPQDPAFDPDQTVLDTIFAAKGGKPMQLLHDYEAACQDLARPGEANESRLQRVADLAHQLEAAGGWALETNAKVVLTQLGIKDTGVRMGTLSGGQRKRVALAHALIWRPDLLILDEPTNHLDADTVAWLETYLGQYTGALLLVTHDRYFLDRVTRRIIEIDRGTVQSFAGNYVYYLEKKEEQEQQRSTEGQKREALIRRELAWLRRGAKARTTKSKARVARAEALIRQPKESPKATLDITTASTRMGGKILELHDLSKSYGHRVLLKNFSYQLKRNDRIGIIGPNGSGKSTLLDMIAGRVAPDDGRVEIGQTVVIGYYDQEGRALDDQQRVIDYVREAAEYVRTASGLMITAGQMLERFLFPPAMQYTPIARLSGGERRRLHLLRVLMRSPNLLLLDEITNDLDIQTMRVLEEYLDGFAGGLIIASHDRYFLDRTVEHLFRLEGDGRVREYPGNYSLFLEIRARESAEAETVAQKGRPAKTTVVKRPAGPRKLSQKERQELQKLEAQIEADEVRKAEMEAQLVTEGSDYAVVQKLYTELQDLNERLDHNLIRWAELAEFA